ncbi:MAG: hypothetical protein WCA07_08270 [Gloeobacterales cyanobacterium]
MDQEKNAGHHAITREAARELFEQTATDDHGIKRIDGMDFEQYYAQLDAGQEYADRVVGGDTWKPYWMDRDAQKRHSMADPAKPGEENLADIRNFVTDELDAAKADHDALKNFDKLDRDHDGFLSHKEIVQGIENNVLTGRAALNLKNNQDTIEDLHDDPGIDDWNGVSKGDLQQQEMRDLGRATHALEDSYSNAHMFRDTSNTADPHAPVESINVFNPVGFGADDTHVEAFDKVPLDSDGNLIRGSDRAAAAASAEMLDSYLFHRDDGESIAHGAFDSTVGSFYQPSSGGVGVNTNEDDPNWQRERDERLNPQEENPMGDYPAPSEDVALG